MDKNEDLIKACQKCIEAANNPFNTLLGILSLLTVVNALKKKDITKCKGCNCTIGDIVKNGRLGCPECYTSHYLSIEHILKRCHDGATQHVGKVPKRVSSQNPKEEKLAGIRDYIKSLEQKMKNAVEVENYEVAGVLKTKIQELQQQLNDSI